MTGYTNYNKGIDVSLSATGAAIAHSVVAVSVNQPSAVNGSDCVVSFGINVPNQSAPCSTPQPTRNYGFFENGVAGTMNYFANSVGIGTPTPTAGMLLSVNGNAQVVGNLSVTGTLSKGSGSFKIDHPLDPANKYLSHSFVESPDMMNIYNGNVVLDGKGRAWVSLPDWFEALNMDFRYQLTPIGNPGQHILYIAKEIANNRFEIAGGHPYARVSWQITGIRHDAYANAHRIQTEEDKGDLRGSYLHPELFEKQQQTVASSGR